MGLLSNLLGKEVSKTLDGFARKAENALTNAVTNAVKNVSNGTGTASTPQPQPQQNQPQQTHSFPQHEVDEFGRVPNTVPKLDVEHKNPVTLAKGVDDPGFVFKGSAAYFEAVISRNIPGVTIRTDVPLTEITSDIPYTKVNIDVLVSDGVKKLAIFIPPKDRYRNACYVYTMNACEAKGVTAIRFMKEFRNDPEYVIGRIKGLL